MAMGSLPAGLLDPVIRLLAAACALMQLAPACGSPRPRATAARAGATHAVDAGPGTARNDGAIAGPGCPASFPNGVFCVAGRAGMQCRYPEGDCVCTTIAAGGCSGAQPSKEELAAAPASWGWTCTSKTATQANGCPSSMPAAGSPCRLRSDVQCDYGDCVHYVYAC